MRDKVYTALFLLGLFIMILSAFYYNTEHPEMILIGVIGGLIMEYSYKKIKQNELQ